MKYRFAGKEKILSIGTYLDVTLADAHEKRSEARRILTAGDGPDEVKEEEKIALQASLENTFEAAAREQHQSKADYWSLRYRDEVTDIFEKDIFPYIDKRPIAGIKPVELLEILCKMEKRRALERTREVRRRCDEVSRYTIVTGKADYNPAPDLASVLATPEKVHPPFLTTNEPPHLLNDLVGYTDSIITKAVTQIIMLTGVCTQELRFTRWEDIDFETKLREIPTEVMKMKRPHTVPFSEQITTLFKQLEPISKHHPLVFIGRNDPRKPISKESVNQVVELLGYKGRLTKHDFRYTVSTILHEKGLNSAWIETQLACVGKDAVRGAYSHAQYLNGRREMMQWYADYVGSLTRENVIHGDLRDAI